MRDAKGAQIYEGTNQIHREIVAGEVLKRGRSRLALTGACTAGTGGRIRGMHTNQRPDASSSARRARRSASSAGR